MKTDLRQVPSTSLGREEKPTDRRSYSRNRLRRTIRWYAILFMGLIVFFASFRSEEVIFVLMLYTSIFIEAFVIIVMIILSEARGSEGDQFDLQEERDFIRNAKFDGNNIIESLNVYVKYATKGSEFSRREIATILRKLTSRKPVEDYSSSSLNKSLSLDPAVEQDLQRVMYPYLDERPYFSRREPGAPNHVNQVNVGISKGESEAYLSGLERIVSKIKTTF